MTESIVFDDINIEVEYDDTLAADETTMLTDPSSSILALQKLRYLKTRETGDEIIIPNTSGRRRIEPIDFESVSYDQYKMRRKAEVLLHLNNVNENKKTQFSALTRIRRGGTNTKLINLQENGDCNEDSVKTKINKGYHSGIRCDGTLLFLDKSVNYNSTL
tara:strand:- start:783 stop:1265 length:483 start_codon:yes stop_codon:yes gene_type:complete